MEVVGVGGAERALTGERSGGESSVLGFPDRGLFPAGASAPEFGPGLGGQTEGAFRRPKDRLPA